MRKERKNEKKEKKQGEVKVKRKKGKEFLFKEGGKEG